MRLIKMWMSYMRITTIVLLILGVVFAPLIIAVELNKWWVVLLMFVTAPFAIALGEYAQYKGWL